MDTKDIMKKTKEIKKKNKKRRITQHKKKQI